MDLNIVNRCLKMDGLKLMSKISDEEIKIVFFDPQYRGILDKMKYGNEGVSRGRERSNLIQMDGRTIISFIREIERILAKSGYLFLWVDKFHLIEGMQHWFKNTSLVTVDMVTWDKEKIGMGYRTRRRSEYIVILQKLPKLAKSTWKIHNIPDVWQEKIVSKTHTHQKPLELQKQLILAAAEENDYVCDPAAGSFSVFEACKILKRNFVGCDIQFGEEIEI